MKPEVQFIAITLADGATARMQFVTRAYRGKEVEWEREATDEAIEAEIKKAGYVAKSWERSEPF